MVTVLAWVVLAALCRTAGGQTIYVNDDGPRDPAATEGSYDNPFRSIQEGIDEADRRGGGTVRVATGTYHGEVRLRDRVRVYGRGPGHSVIDGSGRGRWNALVTAEDIVGARLDGFAITGGRGYQGAGVYLRNSRITIDSCWIGYNRCHYTYGDAGHGGGLLITGPERRATVVRCYIFMNETPDGNGGGLAILNASPRIEECVFEGNLAESGVGGAIYNEDASPEISNCQFRPYLTYGTIAGEWPNSAGYAGAIYNQNSSPDIRDCDFEKNTAADSAGAVGNYGGSSPVIERCRFIQNRAYGNGGAIHNGTGSAVITSCLFRGNRAPLDAGGAICSELADWIEDAVSSPTIQNCTFWQNEADRGAAVANLGAASEVVNCTFSENEVTFFGDGGAGIHYRDGDMRVQNCILWADRGGDEIHVEWGAGLTVTRCDVEGGYPGDNLNTDPLFVDAGAGDFHLQSVSPCLDAGSDVGITLPDRDFEGDSRVLDGNGDGDWIVDIGVDERTSPWAFHGEFDMSLLGNRLYFEIRWSRE
jgi:predicted outer membrane repeat protein